MSYFSFGLGVQSLRGLGYIYTSSQPIPMCKSQFKLLKATRGQWLAYRTVKVHSHGAACRQQMWADVCQEEVTFKVPCEHRGQRNPGRGSRKVFPSSWALKAE